MRDQITLLYDGDCPICKQYKKYIELRKSHDIQLLSAREHPERVRELKEKGYDLNQGMVLIVGPEVYHKEQVMVRFESMIHHKSLYGKIIRRLICCPPLIKIAYPLLKGVRRILLWSQGKDPHL